MNKKLAATLLALMAATAADSEPVALGNVPGEGVISRLEVTRYYTFAQKYWFDGTKFTLVILNDPQIQAEFANEVLGLSVSEYRRMINFAINSGNAGHIVQVKTLDEMISTIEKTPHSLGYITKDYLILRGKKKDVKIIKVVG
jgi:hypothetical protein